MPTNNDDLQCLQVHFHQSNFSHHDNDQGGRVSNSLCLHNWYYTLCYKLYNTKCKCAYYRTKSNVGEGGLVFTSMGGTRQDLSGDPPSGDPSVGVWLLPSPQRCESNVKSQADWALSLLTPTTELWLPKLGIRRYHQSKPEFWTRQNSRIPGWWFLSASALETPLHFGYKGV